MIRLIIPRTPVPPLRVHHHPEPCITCRPQFNGKRFRNSSPHRRWHPRPVRYSVALRTSMEAAAAPVPTAQSPKRATATPQVQEEDVLVIPVVATVAAVVARKV